MNFKNTLLLNGKEAGSYAAKTIYKVLFSLLWVHYTAYLFLYRIFVRIPIVTIFADAIFPLCTILLIALSFPFFIRKTKLQEVLIYLFLVVAVCFSLIFSSEKVSMAIENEWMRVVLFTAPFIFVGACFEFEENEKLLFIMSVLGVISLALFQIYALVFSDSDMIEDNMGVAYNALPAVAYLFYYAANHSRIFTWVIALLSFVLMFSYGTRGTILCLLVYISILIIYRITKMRSLAGKMLLISLIAAFLFLCFFTSFITDVMISASELFENVGFSTRIFEMFLEESIADDTGRGDIANRVLQGVSENAIFGYGVMGDRNFVTNYAHNILYELWCSFGVILGTLLFAAIIMLPIYAIIKTKSSKEKLFIWMLLSITIVKLFMSSSYLYEVNLFLMIGYSISVIRKNAGMR